MTPRIPENVSSWLVDWSFAPIMGNTMPPRDPTTMMMMPRTKMATPSRATSSGRSSENPTNSTMELHPTFVGVMNCTRPNFYDRHHVRRRHPPFWNPRAVKRVPSLTHFCLGD